MTTAHAAILAAWKPLLAGQRVAERIILERYADELARLAVQALRPSEGEKFMRFLGQAQAQCDGAKAGFEQAMRNAQRDFA